jgi:hypothetical protein
MLATRRRGLLKAVLMAAAGAGPLIAEAIPRSDARGT